MFKLRRTSSLIIILSMVMSMMPYGLITVLASDDPISPKYKFLYAAWSQTADVGDAGTGDNNLETSLWFNIVDNKTNKVTYETKSFRMKNSGRNKLATGNTGYVDTPPWCLEMIKMVNTSDDAYKCHYYELYVEIYKEVGENQYEKVGAEKLGGRIYPGGSDNNKKKSGVWYDSTSEHGGMIFNWVYLLKNSAELDGWDEFDDTLHLDPYASASGTVDVEIPGTVSGDRWHNLMGNYSYFDYFDYPTLTITAEANGRANTKYVLDNLTASDTKAISIKKRKGYADGEYTSGFTINKKELLAFMDKNGVNEVKIKTDLYMPGYTVDSRSTAFPRSWDGEVIKQSKTYTIYRDAMELYYFSPVGGLTTFQRSPDSFYNNKANSITVTAYIHKDTSDSSIGNIYGHFNNTILNGQTVEFDKAGIYLGTLESQFLEASVKSATIDQYGKFKFDVNLPANVTSNDYPIILYIENARMKIDGITYRLVNGTSIAGATLKAGSTYEQDWHKVDKIAPKLTNVHFSDKDEVAGNGWKKSATVFYTPSEHLYVGNEAQVLNYYFVNPNADSWTDLVKYITYQNGAGKTAIASNAARANTETSVIVANPSDLQQEISGNLVATNTKDVAGNTLSAIISPDGNGAVSSLKLDNQPPEAIKMEEIYRPEASGDRTVKYSFEIKESSETGRVYYAFTKGLGSAPPEIPELIEAVPSGTIDVQFDKWAFVEQDGDGKETRDPDPTNGVAALKIPKGETFEGMIHYYTEDGLGNTTKNAIKSEEISVANYSTDLEIYVNETDNPPKNNYIIDIETNKHNTVTYYWMQGYQSDGIQITPEKEYTSAEETGSGKQTGLDGEEIILDKSGIYTLVVKATTPDGATTTYLRQMFFDNKMPELTLKNDYADFYKSSHTIKVIASDRSGIAKAKGQLVSNDGKATPLGEQFDIDVNNGSVNTELHFAEMEAGSYMLNVTVTDTNGDTTTKTSAPFNVRNGVVNTTLEAVPATGSADGAELPEVDGVKTIKENRWGLKITAREEFANASKDIKRYLCYATSYDGKWYTTWSDPIEMTPTADGTAYELTTELIQYDATPGLNSLHIRTVTMGDDASFILDDVNEQTLEILYDNVTPTYNIQLDNKHTKTSVEGKLMLSDMLSPVFTIDTNGNGEDKLKLEPTSVPGEYKITVYNDIDTVIYGFDGAGNKVDIPIKVKCFDHTAPEIAMTTPYEAVKDARTDITSSIEIKDADKSSVRFAIIPESDLANATNADGTIKEKYFRDAAEDEAERYQLTDDESITPLLIEQKTETSAVIDGEKNLGYDVLLRGVTGKYYIGVYAEDILGNEITKIFTDLPLNPKDTKLEMGTVSASPKEANTKSKVTVNFNVPVSVLPQNMITDTAMSDEMTVEQTNLEKAGTYAEQYSTTHSFTVTKHGKYKLYTVDELGRGQVFEIDVNSDMVTFGNKAVIEAYRVVHRRWPFVEGEPEEERIPAEDEITIGGVAYAGTNSWTDDQVYQESTRMIVDAPSGYLLKPVLDGADEYGFNYDEGWGFEQEVSAEYYDATGDGYTKLVYTVYEIMEDIVYPDGTWGGSREPDIRDRDVDILYKENTEGSTDWIKTVVSITNVDNSSPQGTLTVFPSTEYGDESQDWKPLNYTYEDVIINMKVSDPQSGIGVLEVYCNDYSSEDYEVYNAELDLATLEYPYTADFGEYGYMTINGDSDIYGIKLVEIVVKKNMDVFICPNNKLWMGNTTMTGTENNMDIDYINKDVIGPEDYTLNYYYQETDGTWQPVVDGEYYGEVKGVLEITEEGKERGAYVSNNDGSGERLFNYFNDSFTYVITDQYKYTHEVTAEFKNFDVTVPEIEYELSTTDKTNKPVDVIITPTDTQSGITAVKLTQGEIELAVTNNGDGTYTGQVANLGTYTITATDKSGNISAKNFVVTNIDSTLPQLANVEYSTTVRTARSVSAKLSYSKPNVHLTKVEATAGFAEGGYAVDYNNSIIRFMDNGTLDVYFTDDYGNEGKDVIAVGNIYKTPPALSAVAVVNQDTMTVDVSFEKAKKDTGEYVDAVRELSEITVSYNGMAKRVEELVTNEAGEITERIPAVFTFNDNGTYTFSIFDDEGISSYLTIEIKDIDKEAPNITQIKWSYGYEVEENGEWVKKTHIGERFVQGEEGYRIATDIHPITKENVAVTVVTDKATTIMGKNNSELATEHTLEYNDNGMYIFNMERPNGLFDQYGFEVAVIDKTPPVIELDTPEIIFYERDESNAVPYSQDVLTKNFTAYDMFGGKTDMTDRVQIDYGEFNPDDFKSNEFDRNKPYTITYTVRDDANNVTTEKLTVRLVGYYDAVVTVNGRLPDFTNSIEIEGEEELVLKLENFSGISFARVAAGIHTMGQMKKVGTIVEKDSLLSKEFVFKPEENGWYTFLVQTDKRDYFNIQVYVYK